jgi:hypothetical protein
MQKEMLKKREAENARDSMKNAKVELNDANEQIKWRCWKLKKLTGQKRISCKCQSRNQNTYERNTGVLRSAPQT